MSAAQTEALAQLSAITGGDDPDRDRAVLESVGWSVERAVQAIFDQDEPQASPVASTSRSQVTPPRTFEPMEMEEPRPRLPPPGSLPSVARIGLGLLSVITLPITVLSNIIQYVFRLLRIPFPRFLGSSITLRPPTSTSSRPPRPGDPRAAAERWVRELEDETGALSVTRAAATATTTATSSHSNGGDLRNREKGGSGEGRGRLLPDFWLGSYESALKAAQTEARMMCVILVSEEHDDTPEFKRNVLTDPDLVRALTDNEFIVWGGDVRDSEAYQTALKLSATTYPFVAFVSLHPRAGGARSSSSSFGASPQLSVVSRHSGSPSTSTSAPTLVAYITTTLVPRVSPLLNRLRAEMRARQQERDLRAEQDRAFAEAERRDRERMLARREEELKQQREVEEKRKQEEARQMAIKWKEEYRRQMKTNLSPEAGPEIKDRLRVGLRLPDGQRMVRFFKPTEPIEALYIWADTGFATKNGAAEVELPANYKPDFDFTLASAFPRAPVPLVEGMTLGQVAVLKGGGNLVVDMKSGAGRSSPARQNGSKSPEEVSSDEDA